MPSKVLGQAMTMYGKLKQLVEHSTLNADNAAEYQAQLTELYAEPVTDPSEAKFADGLRQNILSMLSAPDYQMIYLTTIEDDGTFAPFPIEGKTMLKLREDNLDLYNTYQDNAFIYQGKAINGPDTLALFQKMQADQHA